MQGEDALIVLAPDIPALGFALFAVEADGAAAASGAAPSPATAGPGGTIENRFYRVKVDPKTGGIASLFDKELGRELVDPACPWPLNAYIYEQPEGGRTAVDDMTKRATFRRWAAETAKVEAGERGPVSAEPRRQAARPRCARRSSSGSSSTTTSSASTSSTSWTRRRPSTPRPSISPSRSRSARALEAAAPADRRTVPEGDCPSSVRFEIAGADMAPGTEQLPGTTLDWQTAQHWVEFSGRDARVVWSPVEAPLVQFGDINTGKWQKTFSPANAWVFSYAMNNYWMTNFKASQEGRVEFRYSLTSTAPVPAAAGAGPASDRVASTRFGWEVHTPLVAAWIPAGNKGPITTAQESFLSVDRPNVIVQALWLDEDGTAVVRLREIAGQPADGRLSSAVFLGSRPATGSPGSASSRSRCRR